MDGITSTDDMIAAGERIRDLGAAAVLVKGGHGASEKAVDVLVDSEGFATFEGPRYDYPVHGSGCCLSAAIAGFLARSEPVREACGHAKGFIDAAIREAAVSRSGMHMVQPNIFSQK
jgi:hydroxymethylpyrimidine/phosphomethylpyrimidine kinase